MYAPRPDGVEVELHVDGTWTDRSTERRDAEWLSEYDFDRRTLTLTRVFPAGADGWQLSEIVRDPHLSDPEGRFEVFVAEKGWFSRSGAISGDILKVEAQLDDDGYFSAWHPDFLQDPIICEGTLWGIYYGGYDGPPEKMPRHWVHVSRGQVVNRTEVRPWADAYASWLEWRRRM